MTSNKKKKVCATLNYIEHFLILASSVTGCISFSDFGSLHGIPIGITSCTIGLKICGITAAIIKYKSTININTIEVLISKVLVNSDISQ